MPPRPRAALAYVAFFVAVGAQAQYLILYYRSLDLDVPTSGRLLGLAAAIGLVGAPLWGSVSDRLRGAPVVLFVATAVAAAGAIALSRAGDAAVAALSVALLAAGVAGIGPILDARALETADGGRAGYGSLRAWGSVSYVVSVAGTGVAIDRWGIGVIFAILTVSLLVTGAVGMTLRPGIAHDADRSLRAAGRVFGPSGLGLFLVGAFLAWTTMSGVMSFLPVRFQEIGAPAGVIGAAGALGAAVEVPVMLRFRTLAARLGAHRLLVAGAILFAVRALVAASFDEPAIIVASALLSGTGFALFLVGGVTWVSGQAPPALAATAQGIFQGVTVGLAQVAAGTIGGVVGAAVGLPVLFLLVAVLGLGATAVVAAAVRHGTDRSAIARRAGGAATLD